MQTYTLHQASEILNISYRMARYYKDVYSSEVKKDGRTYLVTDRWIEKVRNNQNRNQQTTTDKTTKEQYREKVEALEDQVQALEKQLHQLTDKLQRFEGYDFDPDTERIEIFTHDDYQIFESAIQEWKSQKRILQVKEESFQEQLASKEELVEHYRNQFDYQRKQSDKILEQMGKLIESIKRRDTIEAVEKKVIGKKMDM